MNSISKKEIANKKDFFVLSAKSVKNIFKEEELNLTFEGYVNTLLGYLNLDTTNFVVITELISDFNLWFNYFSEIEGLTTSIYLKRQNKKLYVDALPKTKININLSNNLKQDILKLKLFIKQLKIQKKMFSQISNYCYEHYLNSCENYMYRA